MSEQTLRAALERINTMAERAIGLDPSSMDNYFVWIQDVASEALAKAAQEQEPVAWVCTDEEMRHRDTRLGRIRWIESEDVCAGQFLYAAPDVARMRGERK